MGPSLSTAPPRWLGLQTVALTVALASPLCPAAETTDTAVPPAAILRDLRALQEMGSVLYVAAHPDDENTQLITYLALGRGYRTAYLSVTRGDGGQNLLGPQFGEELGVARTQELLAARRLDGGRQYFTRAKDFGFSKDYQETLAIWDKDKVLGDVVRVIRLFRPDVIVTRFSPQPGNTHGHHTSSAVLALEAFKLAGDPKAYPEQLKDLQPWQPKRIFQNGGGGRGGGPGPGAEVIRIQSNGIDPVSGESFADIAGQSRAMHKTQGFGAFGGRGGDGARVETFQLLEGSPAETDIMDGVDTSWARITGGSEIGSMVARAIESFDTNNPAASVPGLLAIRSRMRLLPEGPLVDEKRQQLDQILQECLGLRVETTVSQAEIVPGEQMELHHRVMLGASVPVKWSRVRYPSVGIERELSMALGTGQPAQSSAAVRLPASTPLTQPYWLREEGTTGMYRVEDPALIGRPENPPVFPVEYVFEIEGQTLVVSDAPVQEGTGRGDIKRRGVDVIAPVALDFVSPVALFAPGATHDVEVDLVAFRPGLEGTLNLEAPQDWKIEPAHQPFKLSKSGERARLRFRVTAPRRSESGQISANAEVGGKRYGVRRVEIDYAHIPRQLLQPAAQLKTVSLDLAAGAHEVGYVEGAGDDVAKALEQMGCHVTQLSGADLKPENLNKLDAVVFGVRAFNTRDDLAERMPALFEFVQKGGTVLVQYNRPDARAGEIAPFRIRVSQDRVTDENAEMVFLAPDHPALNRPNKITKSDFDGWVQERGLYFANSWDDQFTPILACGDPGQAPLRGGLLVAPYGKGHFVYTGLAFFRQLPAGVPGAYRLFSNLVSLGK